MAVCVWVATNPVFAQNADDTDLSRYQIFDEKQSFKTLADLETMEDSYIDTLSNAGCEAALPLIVVFYESANATSNVIRRGNEPYYDARRDDKDDITRDRQLLEELIEAENTFNALIRQRNKAWVAEAKCLLERGDQTEGVTRLMRALDYISGTDEKMLWEEARWLLWEEVGINR